MSKDNIIEQSLITLSVTENSLITDALTEESQITTELVESSPIGVEDEAPPSPIIPTDQLIARWDGGSILDTSGSTNTYNGTLSANPPTLVPGINGEANGAYNFVGANSQRIGFGSITDIKNVPAITISTWVKKTTGNFITIGDLSASPSQGSIINFNSGDTIFGLIRNGTVNSVSTNGFSYLGSWTNIILIFDGSLAIADRVKLYVNNVSVGAIAAVAPALTANNTHIFYMGFIFNNIYGSGQIAQSLVYKKAITSAERLAIFQQKAT